MKNLSSLTLLVILVLSFTACNEGQEIIPEKKTRITGIEENPTLAKIKNQWQKNASNLRESQEEMLWDIVYETPIDNGSIYSVPVIQKNDIPSNVVFYDPDNFDNYAHFNLIDRDNLEIVFSNGIVYSSLNKNSEESSSGRVNNCTCEDVALDLVVWMGGPGEGNMHPSTETVWVEVCECTGGNLEPFEFPINEPTSDSPDGGKGGGPSQEEIVIGFINGEEA